MMINMAQAAATLYPDYAPAAEIEADSPTVLMQQLPAAEAQASDAEEPINAADSIYEEVVPVDHESVLAEHGFATPEDLLEERAADNPLGYKDTAISPAITQSIAALIEEATPEAPSTLKEAAARGYGDMAVSFGFNHYEIEGLVNAAKTDLKHGHDPEMQAKWLAESREYLTRSYAQRAPEALQAARALVARDPRLAAMLHQTGLTNHPRFVAAMVERGLALKNTGKLKVKGK